MKAELEEGEGRIVWESEDNSDPARHRCRDRSRCQCQCRRLSRFRRQIRDLRLPRRVHPFLRLRPALLSLRPVRQAQRVVVSIPEPASRSASEERWEWEEELLLLPHRERESAAARTEVADLRRDHPRQSCLRLHLPALVRRRLQLAFP